MLKEDINRFYVGELNFSFGINDLSKYAVLTNEQKEKMNLYYKTISCGAIDLEEDGVEKISWSSKKKYKSVYTIFYKMDDGKLLCLHNGKVYDTKSIDYVGNIQDFRNILPQLGYYHSPMITRKEVLELFNNIMLDKKIGYEKNQFDISKFYDGTMELATHNVKLVNEYPYPKEFGRINTLEALLLRKRLISKDCPITYRVGDYEYHFNLYKSLFYLFSDGTIYNLNSHQLYLDKDRHSFMRNISLNEPLTDKMERFGIPYKDDHINIPKVLKLQKKLNK